ncbi:MAG: hypothetical protein AAED33_11965 [Paracoccaceae bacterium]
MIQPDVDVANASGEYNADGVFVAYCNGAAAPVIFTKEGFPIIDDQACIPEPEVLGITITKAEKACPEGKLLVGNVCLPHKLGKSETKVQQCDPGLNEHQVSDDVTQCECDEDYAYNYGGSCELTDEVDTSPTDEDICLETAGNVWEEGADPECYNPQAICDADDDPLTEWNGLTCAPTTEALCLADGDPLTYWNGTICAPTAEGICLQTAGNVWDVDADPQCYNPDEQTCTDNGGQWDGSLCTYPANENTCNGNAAYTKAGKNCKANGSAAFDCIDIGLLWSLRNNNTGDRVCKPPNNL